MKKSVIVLGCLYTMSAFAGGPSDDAVNAEALKKTQELLTNREQRKEALSADPKSKSAGEAVDNVIGSNAAHQDEFYALAAQVFGGLVKKYNGDAKKMAEDMEKFKQNPEAFMNSWSPEEREKLKTLADKVTRIPASPQQ